VRDCHVHRANSLDARSCAAGAILGISVASFYSRPDWGAQRAAEISVHVRYERRFANLQIAVGIMLSPRLPCCGIAICLNTKPGVRSRASQRARCRPREDRCWNVVIRSTPPQQAGHQPQRHNWSPSGIGPCSRRYSTAAPRPALRRRRAILPARDRPACRPR